MFRLLRWVTNLSLVRGITDRAVWCVSCGRSMGYVVFTGHKRWQCEHCTLTGWPEAV